MAVRLDLLISLPELKSLKLVSGSNGIFRIVRWVHIVETPDILNYVQSDELIILTGIAIGNDEASFVKLVNGLIEKKAAGLIVNVGKYFEKIPECIATLGDENEFPIFELPWEVSLADVTRIICGDIVKKHLEEMSYQDLLMNVIFFNSITFEDFAQRISAHGYTSLNTFRVIIVEIDRLQQYFDGKQIEDQQDIAHMKDNFLRSVNSATTDTGHRPISLLQNDSVIVLLINEKDRYINLTMLSELIRESAKRSFPDISINIGIGNNYPEFSKIRTSYLEAKKALKVIKAESHTDWTEYYSDIGVYKLITDLGNMGLIKEYYDDTVGKLELYDAQNDTDFTKIFYVFLQENGNYIQAAQRLYLHRNTLMYKISKIQEIIKKDLSDIKVRYEFYTGYLVKQINNL